MHRSRQQQGFSLIELMVEGQSQPGGSIIWQCGPRDVQPVKPEWLPASCRHPAT